jgi:hypothetical protein
VIQSIRKGWTLAFLVHGTLQKVIVIIVESVDVLKQNYGRSQN